MIWTDRDHNSLYKTLNDYCDVHGITIKHEYGSDSCYEIDITPYSSKPHQTITWNASSDTRVRTNYKELNKACEEINRNLTKSILDEYDLSYIDTDIAATIAAKEAFKKYILEGKNMQFKKIPNSYDSTRPDSKTRPDSYDTYDPFEGYKFVPTGSWNIVPKVKKIIHSGPCTIVFWEDNTKTVVRLEEGKEYDEYAAFTAALAKKCYGSNSKVHKILEKKTVEQKAKKKEAAGC